MKNRINWRLVYTAAAVFALAVQAQAPASVRLSGIVSKVDAASNAITLKTDSGDVEITMQPKGSFRRVAPGETSLTNAATIAISDVNAGDRVLAVGKASDDKTTLAASLVVVMSQGDIAKKQAAERADWDKRGVIGIVTAASPTEIAISVRGGGAAATAKTVIITPAPNAQIKRYAQESIKFSDAQPSTLAEIKTGDQVRALGVKSEDGSKMTAEEIVSGAFREIAATIISVDAAKNEVRVKDLATKNPVVVKINPDSNLRKMPLQMAQGLAARNRPPEPGAGRGGAAPEGRGGGMRGPGGGGGRGGGGDLTQMMERLPSMTLSDLKPGDAIILLSTVGSATDRLNAITMLAGVEPILTKPGTREMELGAWSLGGGIGGEGGQ